MDFDPSAPPYFQEAGVVYDDPEARREKRKLLDRLEHNKKMRITPESDERGGAANAAGAGAGLTTETNDEMDTAVLFRERVAVHVSHTDNAVAMNVAHDQVTRSETLDARESRVLSNLEPPMGNNTAVGNVGVIGRKSLRLGRKIDKEDVPQAARTRSRSARRENYKPVPSSEAEEGSPTY